MTNQSREAYEKRLMDAAFPQEVGGPSVVDVGTAIDIADEAFEAALSEGRRREDAWVLLVSDLATGFERCMKTAGCGQEFIDIKLANARAVLAEASAEQDAIGMGPVPAEKAGDAL